MKETNDKNILEKSNTNANKKSSSKSSTTLTNSKSKTKTASKSSTKSTSLKPKTKTTSKSSTKSTNLKSETKTASKSSTKSTNLKSETKTASKSSTKSTNLKPETKTASKSSTKSTNLKPKTKTASKSSTKSTNLNPKTKTTSKSSTTSTNSKPKTKTAPKSISKNIETEYINPNVSEIEEKLKKLQNQFSNITNSDNTQDNKNLSNSKNTIITNIIISIFIILIIYSSVNIILWQKNNIDNNSLIKQVTEDTPIVNTEQVMITDSLQIEKNSYDFSNLLAQNSDTVGWIHINNTNVNYPVVKGKDNDFYLKHSFDKSYNAAGWIYADYRNSCDETDKNLIIYGHNRLNNNMFGTLKNALSKDWLSNESNHYINYSSINNDHIYQIFSIFICNADDSVNYLKTNFSTNGDFTQYIDDIKSLSIYDFNTTISEDDKIILLYTCHGLNNERLIVCGKLITDFANNTVEQ